MACREREAGVARCWSLRIPYDDHDCCRGPGQPQGRTLQTHSVTVVPLTCCAILPRPRPDENGLSDRRGRSARAATDAPGGGGSRGLSRTPGSAGARRASAARQPANPTHELGRVDPAVGTFSADGVLWVCRNWNPRRPRRRRGPGMRQPADFHGVSFHVPSTPTMANASTKASHAPVRRRLLDCRHGHST